MLRRKIVFSLVILLALITASAFFADRLIMLYIEKSSDVKMSYKSMKNIFFKEFVFEKLEIINSRTGIGVFSENARVLPVWDKAKKGRMPVTFRLENVNFLKRSKDVQGSLFNTLPDLVLAPFSSGWRYKEIAGEVILYKDSILLKNITAVSDEIKLSISGEVKDRSSIRLDIVIYFYKTISKKIPEELSSIAMESHGPDWKSISVRLRGDYKKPEIELSNRLFRLTINNK